MPSREDTDATIRSIDGLEYRQVVLKGSLVLALGSRFGFSVDNLFCLWSSLLFSSLLFSAAVQSYRRWCVNEIHALRVQQHLLNIETVLNSSITNPFNLTVAQLFEVQRNYTAAGVSPDGLPVDQASAATLNMLRHVGAASSDKSWGQVGSQESLNEVRVTHSWQLCF